MIHILMVTPDKKSLSGMLGALDQHDVSLAWAETGIAALSMAADKTFELVVTDQDLGDMTGLECVEKLITMNPMINCAAVSSLSSENFHEESEGLGLLMQLPVTPDQQDTEKLLSHLRNILNLTLQNPKMP